MRLSLISPVSIAAALYCSAVAGAQGGGPPGTAGASSRVVAGVVRDPSGAPLANAEVRAENSSLHVLTDASGMFVLRGLPSDSMRLIVRRLGFRPTALDVAVQQGSTADVEVELRAAPVQLTPVIVAARAEVFESRLAGFYNRSKRPSGHVITKERFERLTSHRFSDLLREVPGVKFATIGRGPGSQRTIRLRGANCPPFVFIDGIPASAGEFDIDIIEPSTVEGVEIYHGLATVPAEFLAARGGERCGVIAIWSRPYRPIARRQRGKPIGVAELLAGQTVFTAERVDIVAELKPRTAIAIFPDSLWQLGISGRVLTEFVVDTVGLVELETVGIVSSSHSSFSRAAVDAVGAAVFRPALKNGRPVRQIVQLPFVFEPVRPPREP